MEEAKKEIKVGAANAPEQKVSYEKLTEIANQLHSQNQQLHMRVRELEFTLNQVRMEYLFKAVELSDKFPSDFIEMCTNDIVKALSPMSADSKEG